MKENKLNNEDEYNEFIRNLSLDKNTNTDTENMDSTDTENMDTDNTSTEVQVENEAVNVSKI